MAIRAIARRAKLVRLTAPANPDATATALAQGSSTATAIINAFLWAAWAPHVRAVTAIARARFIATATANALPWAARAPHVRAATAIVRGASHVFQLACAEAVTAAVPIQFAVTMTAAVAAASAAAVTAASIGTVTQRSAWMIHADDDCESSRLVISAGYVRRLFRCMVWALSRDMRHINTMKGWKEIMPGIRCDSCLRLWALWLMLGVMGASAAGIAQNCKAPTSEKRVAVEAYVIKRFNISSPADIILVEDKQANDGCFWKMQYEVSSSKREITLFLSPDGNFLLPTLYDIRVDPLLEEKARREQIAKNLSAGDLLAIGPEKAPVTIVEFADFQCPYCKRMADTLEHDFLPSEAQNVRLVYKSFPLPMHNWAMAAAKMAECAALQKPSEFWKVHDYLFEHQKELTADNLRENFTAFVAANTGIDKTQFQSCVDKDLALGPVNQDVELGRKNGVHATPTIFINGVLFSGLKSADQLKRLVDDAMHGTLSVDAAPAPIAQAVTERAAQPMCQGSSTRSVQ
jgi:protein-disulfide isomerase